MTGTCRFLRRLTLVLCVSLPAAASAAPAREPPSLQERVAALVGTYQKQYGGSVGVSVVELPRRRPWVAIRDQTLLTPASNQKLLATAAALVRLGAGFQFQTRVYVLADGSVFVCGDYDPTLGDGRLAAAAGESRTAGLDRWAAAIRAALPTGPPKQILLEDSPDPRTYRHPDWPDAEGRHGYAARVSRLNFNNNCWDVSFTVRAGRVHPHVFPVSRLVRVVNETRVGPKHLWRLTGNGDDSVLRLRGTIQRTTPDALSVAARIPALLLGRALAERLVRAGIAFDGPVRIVPPVAPGQVTLAGSTEVCVARTPLAHAMRRANIDSLNMAAECLFLRSGDGTWAGSAKIMAETLTRTYGVEAGQLVVRDGGGLSRKNRVSPAAMTAVLCGVAAGPNAAAFLDSLAISGRQGTLSGRMKDLAGRVRGKTGYLRGVCGLSGYVLDTSGQVRAAFSMTANNFLGRAANFKAVQDTVCRLLVAEVDQEARAAGNGPTNLPARPQSPPRDP